MMNSSSTLFGNNNDLNLIFKYLYQNEYMYYLFYQNNSMIPLFLCHSSKYMSSFPNIGLETPSSPRRRTKFLYLSQSTGHSEIFRVGTVGIGTQKRFLRRSLIATAFPYLVKIFDLEVLKNI
jgi:hypothetical protein